jgi:simple sugar transport system permease protein
MRLERRTSTPASLVLLNIALVLGLMAATGSVLIAQAGAPVGASWLALLNGAFGSKLAITETLTRATPLIFTGLACAIAFRSRLWNIGAEGQLYAGALAVAALGSGVIQAPGYVLIPIVMLAAALAGAAMLMGPALLKRYMNVDDVVTTLLLNFIMALFVSIMVQGPMRDPMSMGWPQTLPVLDEATLDKLITQSRLHTGLLLALALSVVLALMESRSVFGLQRRAVGLNPEAARFAGIPATRVLLWTTMISGGLAGIAGAVEVMGMRGYVTGDLSPGFGYTGVIVAMLAQLHPLGVPVAAVLVASVFVGADAMSRMFNVPSFIADVMVSLSLLSMLAGSFFLSYRIRR